jgi:hypothetical protein
MAMRNGLRGKKSSIATRGSGLCCVRWNMEVSNRTLPSIAVVVGCFAATLGGCGLNDLRDVSLSDRCADVMQRAFPEARIEITKQEAYAAMNNATAAIQGVSTGTPADATSPRKLAAECKFDNNILTGFRWTSGPLI